MESMIVMFAVAASGCAPMDQARQRQFAANQRYIETIPTCSSDKECEVKWAAARRFVLANSDRKIQSITNDFIETYNPAPNSPGLAWRVTKDPAGDGKSYEIRGKAWCANMFGCSPGSTQTMQRFNEEVAQSWRPALSTSQSTGL